MYNRRRPLMADQSQQRQQLQLQLQLQQQQQQLQNAAECYENAAVAPVPPHM